MSSGNYESQILEAIQILVNDAVSKAEYDKTIQGTISRCVDKTIGKYIVRYQDSSFYAYSSNTDTTYPAGTGVYVLVPGNDMAKHKTIVGTVDHLGPDYVSIIEGENGYEVTGVNTIGADGTFGLCSYKENDITILYDRDNEVDLIGLDEFGFKSYIEKSKSIICGATFKTALETEQKFRGDYGIVFNLDFIDKSTGETITKSYMVNVDQMTGNPYNYTVASRQYGIFDVDGANFQSVKQIYLFAYNFPNKADNKPEDIFVSKVELSAANALEKEAAATCALTFVTPQGTYFDEQDLDTDTRTLEAQIRIKGNAIDNDSQNVEYYWFRENNNITSKSEKYNQYGGSGWECLNAYSKVQDETETNEAVVQWTKGNYRYITKKADNVARETTYKCVAVYFDGTILSKTIVIYNYDSNYEIEIKSDSGVAFSYDLGKPTLTCYVNGQEETSDTYDYVWSVINSSNQFSILEETATKNDKYNNAISQRDALLAKVEAEQILSAQDQEKLSLYNQTIAQYEYIMRVEENKIHNLTISAITNFSTYKCSVYKSGIFIGTASIIITNSESTDGNYTLIIDNGNQVFKYNENGISPANGSVKNPIIVMPLGFTLYDDKGQKINHNVVKNIEWKVPGTDTLISVSNSHTSPTKNADGTLSYFNVPELNFNIRENYNAAYDKNEVQLIITHNDKVVSAKTNLTFVKEGENGTNGTDFVCKIVPNEKPGEITPRYPAVIYDEYTKQYQLNYTPKSANQWFKVQLWHDGELIYTGTESGKTLEDKQAKVQWSMLQNTYGKDKQTGELIQDVSNFIINKDTAEITFNATELENPANIVRCVVNYNNVDYYATLPITIIRIAKQDYDVQLVNNSGFREVMYTTDGQRPTFDNQPFELTVFQTVNGVKSDISHFTNSEFAVDYDWKERGSVYYSKEQPNLNLIKNTLKSDTLLINQVSYKPVDTYNGLCVNNAVVCRVTSKKTGEEIAFVHIPIHFYLNRYGNAAMNGWDGNSISLDENGTTILAPQIGAGSKNDDNTFTGVFMGSVKEPGAEKEEHGLFGYNAGQRTITLNSEDGSARFGKTGAGQIIIDPTQDTAQLKSGDYVPAEYNSEGKLVKAGSGMLIDLTEPKIEFGSGKFSVDKDGNVTADSFATREEVQELEESISIFNATLDRDSVLITSTADQYPMTTEQHIINFTGLYKGKETYYFTAEIIDGHDSGIETTVTDNQIIFKVDKTKQIQNSVNTYTIQFKFSDVITIKTYTVNKTITVALATQGKDGYQGSDGKSAYQIWLEAGYTGTEEEYLASLKGKDGEPGKEGPQGPQGNDGAQGPQGEPGKNGEQGPKGEDGYTPQKGVDYFDGKDGEKGEDGTGVTSIITQYYLSSSNTSQTGGSWKNTQDTWVSGKYFWTREQITWSDGRVTETTPILADGLNKANQTAATADSNASSAVNTANTANTNANQAKQDAATATSTANTASQTASSALEKANEATSGLSSLSTIVENNYKDLQGQIDGAIATWFYDYDPNTANTLPTKDWTTDTIKDQHLGDLFYIIDNEEKAGQCFRYAKVDGVYKWVMVEDVEVAKAIADAANAQATADGKATIFTGTTVPKDPQAGDLWMKSANDGILTYVNGAWVEYNKYTDDALAQTAKNTADSANTAAGEAKTAAQTATNTANTANQTANAAKEQAQQAENTVKTTVKKIDVEYARSTSSETAPTTGWSTNAPEWVDGEYIWSRNKTTYVNGTSTEGKAVCITGGTGATGGTGPQGPQGATGGTGPQGIGVSSITELYFAKANTTAPAAPTAQVTTNSATAYNQWNKALATYSASYPHYFTCSEILYTNNTRSWSAVVYAGAITSANQTASSAQSTANTANTNASNAVSTANTANTNAQNAVNTANTANQTASTANTNAQNAVDTANTAKTTAETAEANVKNTVKQVETQYYLSTSATELKGGSWSTATPTWTSGSYIWTRQKFTYVDTTKQATYSNEACMTGATGKAGTDGKIYYTWIKYSNGTAASMSDDPSGKTHIGIAYNKESMVESNTYSDYAWSLIKGEDGEPGYTPVKGKDYFDGAKGDKGDKGDDGTDAINIKTIKTQYYLSTSKTSATGGSWSDTQQAWSSGKYFWIRDVIIWDTTPETTTTTTGVLAASLNQANETANTANSTANTANSTANSANSKADSAVSTANTANSTANTAKTTAENASSKADSASSKADAASTAASKAATAASNADKKADEAKKAAATAQTTANSANTKAEEAKTVATEADTKATEAQEDLETLILSTETQYCLGSSTTTPPLEDDAGWSSQAKVGNTVEEEYLWSRTKNITKTEEIFYSNYYCLVQAQKILKSQTTEYLLSASSDFLSDEEKAEGVAGAENLWRINKPTDPVEGKDYLWTRTHAVYNYVGAGLDGQVINEYYDYTLDTSWHVLFSLTNSLRDQIKSILTDITGGYVHIADGVILVGNDKNNPSKLIVINHKGIAFFDNTEEGWPDSSIYDSQTSAWTIDGQLNMDQIDVNGLKASSIENENLILGKGTEQSAALSGDLDIYDKYGNLMFETIVNEDNPDATKNDYLIHGFKIYKYVQNENNTLSPNGYIYLSRDGLQEYDAGDHIVFGNNGLEQFTATVAKVNQHVITNQLPDETQTADHYGVQMIPMKITGAGDNLTHIGIAFLKY